MHGAENNPVITTPETAAAGAESNTGTPPVLSIVIPCKNEVDYIGRLLQSLERQTYDLSKVPIYIADSNSTDGTREFLEHFSNTNGLDIHVIDGGYPSKARNAGAAMTDSRYILFLDADIYLDEDDFIETVVRCAEISELDCVGTLVKSEHAGWKDQVIWNSMRLFMYAYPLFKPFSAGMCIFMRRKAFEALGGFDEDVILGEDVELTSQVDKRRFGIARRHVVTTNRRFRKLGYTRTMWMYTNVKFSKRYRHRDHRSYFT